MRNRVSFGLTSDKLSLTGRETRFIQLDFMT